MTIAIVLIFLLDLYTPSPAHATLSQVEIITNSSCGVGYPYAKCYAGHKVLRIFTPNEQSINVIDKQILNGEMDINVWSEPEKGMNDIQGQQDWYELMISPCHLPMLLQLFESSNMNYTILNYNVVDMLKEEAKMVSFFQ